MPAAQNNNADSAFLRSLKAFFLLFLSLILAGCSNEPKLPEPPISFPFLAWKAGEKLDFQFRIKEQYAYVFSISIYHKKDDKEDRERLYKLVGDGARNKLGEAINTGVAIPLQLKPFREENGNEREMINQNFSKPERYGYDMQQAFSKEITSLGLMPGNYRCQIESLTDIPEFLGTEMKSALVKNHAK